MKEYVLDANPLVRLFRNAPGAKAVDDLVRQAKSGRAHLSISVVNLAEVLYALARYFGQEKALVCIDTAILRTRYKLGLADCFAAELSMRLGATLVTADPEFGKFGKQLNILALPRHSG